MSWLTSRAAQSASKYRYIRFVGGRILQGKELTDLQDVEEQRDHYQIASLIREGSLLNASFTISGSNLVLARKDTGFSWVLASFNGTVEPIAEQSIALPTAKASGTDTLYLHWVIWRVTNDGTYQTRSGCLADSGLVDITTGEAVGERGQLQFTLDFSTALSEEAIDTDRMLSKSTTALPVIQVSWTSNVATLVPLPFFQTFTQATTSQLGTVKLSAAGDTAVASDDSRLSDQRVPVALSVSTSKVSVPETDTGTSEIGTAVVKASTTTGVDSARVFFSGISVTAHALFNWLYTTVTGVLATLTGHGNRITALENKPEQVVDLSYHIGKPLGRVSAGGLTHEPSVTDMQEGFRHYGPASTTGFGGWSAAERPMGGESYMAYSVYANDKTTVLGGITMEGDFVITNPAILNGINAAGGGPLITYCGGREISLSRLCQFIMQR